MEKIMASGKVKSEINEKVKQLRAKKRTAVDSQNRANAA